MAFGSADKGGSNATPAVWNTLGSQNQQHLEAYILRTTVKSLQNSSITGSYDIDFLPLDNDAMVAHIENLGSGYSIIKAIGELSPEQLRLIQERTKARDGQLVSVQFGAAADMVTSMGTFKAKPVIFVVKTAAALTGPIPSSTKHRSKIFPIQPLDRCLVRLQRQPRRACSGQTRTYYRPRNQAYID
jgi:hypothetical protein